MLEEIVVPHSDRGNLCPFEVTYVSILTNIDGANFANIGWLSKSKKTREGETLAICRFLSALSEHISNDLNNRSFHRIEYQQNKKPHSHIFYVHCSQNRACWAMISSSMSRKKGTETTTKTSRNMFNPFLLSF